MSDLIIISGFLGSGKTSLIKRYLNQYQAHEPLIILENDFGSIQFDQNELTAKNSVISELSNGCICCSLGDDLSKTIEKIQKTYHPTRIVIEPSGIANLSEVILQCSHPRISVQTRISAVITVVNAHRHAMYSENFDDFYTNQISACDTLVLSHTDLVSSQELPSFDDKPCLDLQAIDDSTVQHLFETASYVPQILVNHRQNRVMNHVELRSEAAFSETTIRQFVDWLASNYVLVRIKGVLIIDDATRDIQYTWSALTIQPSLKPASGVTLIGEDLDPAAIQIAFNSLARL